MSTFELYMLASGWDNIELWGFLMGFAFCIIAVMLIVIKYPCEVGEVKVRYIFITSIITVLLFSISIFTPSCNQMIKVYSAKYGSQEVQKQLSIFKEANK